MAAPIELGTLLFTAVEPHRGHEVDYNRWHGYDHFYAGCMVGTHQFAGRRFVVTGRLKDLRSPADSPLCPDPSAASYLAIYGVLKGFHDEWGRWAVDRVKELHAEGRMFAHRDHTHTAVYEHRSSIRRDPRGTSIELALDRDFEGSSSPPASSGPTQLSANSTDGRPMGGRREHSTAGGGPT